MLIKTLSAFVLALSLTSAAQAQSSGERALGGALIGGAAGAIVGGAVSGNAGGALIGAGVGGATGAIIGSQTGQPERPRRVYRDGRPVYRDGRPVYRTAQPVYYEQRRRPARTVCRINRYGEEVCRVYR